MTVPRYPIIHLAPPSPPLPPPSSLLPPLSLSSQMTRLADLRTEVNKQSTEDQQKLEEREEMLQRVRHSTVPRSSRAGPATKHSDMWRLQWNPSNQDTLGTEKSVLIGVHKCGIWQECPVLLIEAS